MVKAFIGDLAAGERKIMEAMTYGLENGIAVENVMGPVGAVLYMIRRAQGPASTSRSAPSRTWW